MKLLENVFINLIWIFNANFKIIFLIRFFVNWLFHNVHSIISLKKETDISVAKYLKSWYSFDQWSNYLSDILS
jgi:hypothetical protein